MSVPISHDEEFRNHIAVELMLGRDFSRAASGRLVCDSTCVPSSTGFVVPQQACCAYCGQPRKEDSYGGCICCGAPLR